MKLDLKAFVNNRRVQVGAAVTAAVAGGLVWYRGRKASAAAPAAAGTGSDSSGSTVAGGFPNTSGSDLASILGDNAGSTNDALASLGKTLEQIQTELGNMQPTHPTGGTTPPIVTPKPKPATPSQRSVTVTAFSASNPAWSSTLSGIAGHEHTTVAALLKLNPSIKNANVIRTGSKVRVA